jgi:hypothetical protein
MPGKPVTPSPAVACIAALALAACAAASPKSAPAKPAAAAAAAPAAPVPCQEEPGRRPARVAGGEIVSLTTCARPASQWAAERPGIEALRPHLNP